MNTIPLAAVPSQSLYVVLNGSLVKITVYKKNTGTFIDINADGTDLITCALCANLTPILPREYYGFSGNFIFVDMQGSSNPDYTGFGTRYFLTYHTADEVA